MRPSQLRRHLQVDETKPAEETPAVETETKAEDDTAPEAEAKAEETTDATPAAENKTEENTAETKTETASDETAKETVVEQTVETKAEETKATETVAEETKTEEQKAAEEKAAAEQAEAAKVAEEQTATQQAKAASFVSFSLNSISASNVMDTLNMNLMATDGTTEAETLYKIDDSDTTYRESELIDYVKDKYNLTGEYNSIDSVITAAYKAEKVDVNQLNEDFKEKVLHDKDTTTHDDDLDDIINRAQRVVDV